MKHCIVAASGPSLTPQVAEQCRGYHVIAVNDAVFLMPFADILYACDERWWDFKDHSGFKGEKWSSHELRPESNNNKLACQMRHGLKLIDGRDEQGFSTTPGIVNYGANSGFQAIQLAMYLGACRIILVGFDMRAIDGKEHFFGSHPKIDHPDGFAPIDFNVLLSQFKMVKVPAGVEIINATPDSALICFPMISLDNALARWRCEADSIVTA